MTEVIRKRVFQAVFLIILGSVAAYPQAHQSTAPGYDERPKLTASIPAKPAEQLYLQLRRVGLNPARTYKVRSAAIDRPSLHLTFDDGMISFTQDVQGRVTGAFFEGDGEVLLTPTSREERASMALGTGMAILEERFNTAYLRFNDETFSDFQPFLRPTADAQEFATRFDATAQNLAELDALRIFATLSRSLPVAGQDSAPLENPGLYPAQFPDHYLHIRVEGEQLGPFDIHYDSLAYEQLSAGQSKEKDGVSYYDVWTSFSPNLPGSPSQVALSLPEDPLQIESYKINAEVKPPTDLTVDASLNVQVRTSGDRTIFFELSRFLQVKQVEVNGLPMEFINNPALDGTQLARRGNDQVAVVFPKPLQKGDAFTLRFIYGGAVLSEAGGGLLYVGARGAWYPNRGLITSNFDLTFRYPRGWTLIATGTRVAGAESGDDSPPDGTANSLLEARWKSERPIALAGFNLGKYVKATARAGSVIVETYAARGVEKDFPQGPPLPPLPDMRGLSAAPDVQALHPSVQPSPAKHAQAVADDAARSVEFFAERFGPFPYHSLSLTQMPGPVSQGWPGLIFLSSLSFLTTDETEGLHLNAARASLRRLALAHETAHQWWGDLVTWKSYRDQWIVEALANYCALMKIEGEHPAEFRTVLEQYRKDLVASNKEGELLRDAGPVTLGQRLSSSHFPDGYEAISYGRGTWLFHMLRFMLRDADQHSGHAASLSANPDEPFVRILRTISQRYAGRPIDTHELFSAFAEELPPALQFEGKQSLDWFEDGWVRGTALPRFSLRNLKLTPKNGATAVSGVLLQNDAPPELVTSVPIYAVVGRKNIFLARILADGPETTIRFTAPLGTRAILIDPDGTLLTGNK